jgi:hypothetical protein
MEKCCTDYQRLDVGMGVRSPHGVPRIHASDDAIELIRRRGGTVWAWPTHHRCCGGLLTLLDASLEQPGGQHRFRQLDGPGFDLCLDTGSKTPPDEIVIELRGRRTKRIEVYWNGCAWVD